jgi:hypothetical protein
MELLNYKGGAMSRAIGSFRATMSRFLNYKIQSKAPTPRQSPSTNSASPNPTFDFTNIPPIPCNEYDDKLEQMVEHLQGVFSQKCEIVHITSSNGSFSPLEIFADALEVVIIGSLDFRPKLIQFGPEFNDSWVNDRTSKVTNRVMQSFREAGIDNTELRQSEQSEPRPKINPPVRLNTALRTSL